MVLILDGQKGGSFAPPETRVWYFLGIALDIDFNYAKKREFVVDGNPTRGLIDYMLKAEEQENEPFFPLVLGDPISYSAGFVPSTKLSLKIYDYLSRKGNSSSTNEFNEKYSSFITACRKTARNIIKAPRVRLNFETSLTKEAKIYGNFIEYLRTQADNEDVEKRWNQLGGSTPW